MKIITISSSHTGLGKSYLATELLKHLKGWVALKVTVSRKGQCGRGDSCGVCNKLSEEFSIITDEDIILHKGKDTRRLKDAGAEEVIWLQATPRGLKDGLKQAISRFKKAQGLIIEGTSVLKYIKPHLAIFIQGKGRPSKPSAQIALKEADIILEVK